MQIDFDPDKDTRNIAKHGMPLAAAEGFEWDAALIWSDLRRDYGEDRMIALGYIGQRLFCMVFVEREGGVRRVISLRKANLREIKRYAET